MPHLVVDSFNKGLGLYGAKALRGYFQKGKALDIRKLRDSLACNERVEVDQNLDGEEIYTGTEFIKQFVRVWVGTHKYLYGIGNKSIYKRNNEIDDFPVWDKLYDGSSEILAAESFRFNSGTWYLFWITADGKFHEKEIPGASNWSDVDAG